MKNIMEGDGESLTREVSWTDSRNLVGADRKRTLGDEMCGW